MYFFKQCVGALATPTILALLIAAAAALFRLRKRPTAHCIQPRGIAGNSWLPTSRGLRNPELALHEYLGLTASAAGAD
jgi:hypothetical protein